MKNITYISVFLRYETFFQPDDYQLLNYILLDSRQRRVIKRATAVFEDDLAKVKNAFDNNDSTFYELSSTDSTKPWIQLELSDKGSIKQIRIFNMLGGCRVTISKAEVRVGNVELTTNDADEMQNRDLCGSYEKEDKNGEYCGWLYRKQTVGVRTSDLIKHLQRCPCGFLDDVVSGSGKVKQKQSKVN